MATKIYDNFNTSNLVPYAVSRMMHLQGIPTHILQFSLYIVASSKKEAADIMDGYYQTRDLRIASGNDMTTLREEGVFEKHIAVAVSEGGDRIVVDAVTGDLLGKITFNGGKRVFRPEGQ